MALKLQSRTGKYALWLFLLIVLNATCNADNDHLAMCKIDNVVHPGIFGDEVKAKMPKVKAVAVFPYRISN